ncbi:MAG: Do family serine endopeptidase [Gemmatimonadaceae bacterium]
MSRVKIAIVASLAFIGGLVFASGIDLTPFSYAQQRAGEAKPPAQIVQPLAEASNAFVSIAEHVTPAVVSIQTENRSQQGRSRRPRGLQVPPGQQIPPGFEQFFEQFEQQRQMPVEGTGSGFIVSKDGYILTNNHVVQGADRVNVTLLDKRVFRAKVVGSDPSTDVAVIKIEATNLPTLPFGDDATARVGEWVVAIGNPLGFDFTVTAGIISAKGRSGDLRALYNSQYAIIDYIQTDAAINQGNSGGPLVNIRGEVIGINSAIASPTGVYAGYGFAVPIGLAKSVMEDLIRDGRVRRAVLGVGINEVSAADAQAAGLTEIRGALVGGFNPPDDSPAKRAGLAPGDVIVAIAGRAIDRVATLQRIVRDREPGDVIEVTVMRYGERKTFKVKLGEAPSEESVSVASRGGESSGAQPITYDKLGISVEPVSAEFARQAELAADKRGVLVTAVQVAGPAYRLLARNDVILEAGSPSPRREIRTVADLERVVNSAKNGEIVSLLVYNADQKQTRVVNMGIED